jgi:hypothetical protein
VLHEIKNSEFLFSTKGSRLDEIREDDLGSDVGPPDLESQNGGQMDAVFSDEETDVKLPDIKEEIPG